MGNSQKNVFVNFKYLRDASNSNDHCIINTMSMNYQTCLIHNTVDAKEEQTRINQYIDSSKKETKIIIYGLNNCDTSVYDKRKQLTDLGFTNVYIYVGGMFEWLLLQDVFGQDEVKTTSSELDILKYA
jgi:hypothetical protein